MKRKSGRKIGRFAQRASGTALAQYQRLESTGLWRETPEAQRRELIVRMGEATLILSDPRSGAVVTHWSLPAVERLNPGVTPALFSPGEDAAETIEIEDTDMIAALKLVQSAVRAGKARPWRLRGWLVGGTFAAIAALALLVLPGVITRHTAAMVPSAKRAEIGQTALDDLTRLTGSPCDGELGLPALADLSERVFGPEDTPILYVLPEGLSRPAHLPGGMILLPRALVDADQPDALAGAALAEGMAAKSHDPMLDVLNHAGLRATFTMLTSGALPDRALSGYGEEILRQTSPDIPLNALTIAFRDAQIPMAPYARWLERQPGQAERAASLLAADPYRDLAPSPLMPDDNWIALQSVCSG